MRTPAILLLTGLMVVGLVLPAAAVAPDATGGEAAVAPSAGGSDAVAASQENGSEVNVTVGQQLSTVIQAEDADVRTEVEESGFEAEFEGANESERAEALADRAEQLRERAEDIREQYREATEAYEEGEISRDEYARRLAVLNARAGNLLESVDQLQARAGNVSAIELQAAGLNRSELAETAGSLENVTGVGPQALLQRFTGQSSGELEIKTEDGFSVEAESENGERSRELRRPRDENHSITIDQSAALETARAALSDQAQPWSLTKASVHPDSGYLKFEFAFRGNETTGEAEVRVDGSTGEVFRVEEEIERLDHDDEREQREEQEDEQEEDEEDEHEGEEDEHEDHEVEELAMVVVAGQPAPNATITVRVLADGDPAPNATVTLDGERVGTTGANGTLQVTLPAGKSKLLAHLGDEDAELEFEFEREDHPAEHLSVDASYDGEAVTLTVRYDGSAVQGLTVYANGDRVGTTDADGTVTFATNATGELEVEFVKGEFEAERKYELEDGQLVPGESEDREDDGEDDEGEDQEDDSEDDESEGDDDEGDDGESDDGEGDEEEDDESDDEDSDEDQEVDHLGLSVVDGHPAPNATITVQVTADGEPVAGATVTVEGEVVGETGSDGTLHVTLPDADEVRIEAEYGGESDRVEFEFDD